ncbi:Asp23/Gls24 family envelope stress response protein [Actinomyces bowdenii]|uniref:Asp23/Gls24 family envelope stress response protein n=1 Tax=Actinomyces bowdenii TaxID=131109 RepID=UPI00214CC33C|nr:Asp23/Gls24 family envelope stress response protein [Actinomyces bowdenii]MCR2053532.1 Asp23/Gls24 family envelope stress response protein [Actinomyces bowdenii]
MTPTEPTRPSTQPEQAPASGGDQEQATQDYHRLIASIHEEWDALESQSDLSVMPSTRVMQSVMAAVRADARHGAQVQAPPTDLGPYTLTELSLRTLVRHAVDRVAQARGLCSSFEHAPATDGHQGLGVPTSVHCRISAHASCQDLPALAQQVRESVLEAFRNDLDSSPTVNIHVEDLHDDD